MLPPPFHAQIKQDRQSPSLKEVSSSDLAWMGTYCTFENVSVIKSLDFPLTGMLLSNCKVSKTKFKDFLRTFKDFFSIFKSLATGKSFNNFYLKFKERNAIRKEMI